MQPQHRPVGRRIRTDETLDGELAVGADVERRIRGDPDGCRRVAEAHRLAVPPGDAELHGPFDRARKSAPAGESFGYIGHRSGRVVEVVQRDRRGVETVWLRRKARHTQVVTDQVEAQANRARQVPLREGPYRVLAQLVTFGAHHPQQFRDVAQQYGQVPI